MREALEGEVYKQCRETFLSLLPDGVKPYNGSTSRGVLEIVAEPGPEFFSQRCGATRSASITFTINHTAHYL